MKYVGYHRTSTKDQHLERGIEAIMKFCKERNISLYKNKVYTDQQTGKDFNRPGYLIIKQELLEPGDVLIISELDRLGRNKEGTLKELRYFKENNIRVMILEIPTTLIDYGALEHALASMLMETVNNLLIEMYATFAEAEMQKRENRQKEGIEQMKAKGEWERYGRPRKMSQEEFDKEFEKVEQGKLKPFQLQKQLNLTLSTFYRYRDNYKKRKEKEQKIRYLEEVKREREKIDRLTTQLSEEQVERTIADIMASMAMEGFELTEENLESARLILTGKMNADELVDQLINKYKENL